MNVFKTIAVKIWRVILTLFGHLRRALCCTKRRRRNSDTALPISVKACDNLQCKIQPISSEANEFAEGNWNSWEENSVTVNNQLNCVEVVVADETRAGQMQKPMGIVKGERRRSGSQSEQEPDIDFFQDMRPTIKRQQKVLIGSRNNNAGTKPSLNKFDVDLTAATMMQSAELETWDDSTMGEPVGWESEADSVDTEYMLRQSRMAERERRLADSQRRNIERNAQKKQQSRLQHPPLTAKNS